MTTSEPTTGEIVRELETLLPPMTNYAESVCAEGAFAHSTHMVWDDPEPYIIKNGIDRLKSQEQTIAALTARAEQAERERDALLTDFSTIERDGLCEVCSFGDSSQISKEDCMEDCCFNYRTWRGAREGEGK